MSEFLKTCLIVCPLIFLAGFVDSVAGGGGIISIPAYLMAGLPVHLAAGTNKIVNGCVYWKLAVPALCCNILGNMLGAQYAIKGGSKKVRGMMFVVLGLLFAKMLYELLS